MRLKILKPIASYLGSFQTNDVVYDVPPMISESWVMVGLAEELDDAFDDSRRAPNHPTGAERAA